MPEPKQEPSALKGCASIAALFVILFGCTTFLNGVNRDQGKTKAQKLSEWYADLSPYTCETYLEKSLRDPDSYKRDGNFVTPTDSGSEKIITWKFRAKNGFGGYNSSIAICKVSKEKGGTVDVEVVGG